MEVDPGGHITLRGEVYVPREGDLVLMDDHGLFAKKMYQWRGTDSPLHTGIICKQADGALAIMEAGPNFVRKVFLLDPLPRLHDYAGTVLVRRLHQPLNPEQSARLTEFAHAQEGKKYAMLRLALHATPFRPRGPLRTQLFGKTVLDRDKWMCCEVVGAAATVAGVLDPSRHFTNAMYPRDYCYDEVFDLSDTYEPPALWYPEPNLRMVNNAIVIVRQEREPGGIDHLLPRGDRRPLVPRLPLPLPLP